jgi:serine/threonine-protein kinase
MSQKPSFFAELQRRHVYKVGAAYVVAGWLFVQVVTQVFPIFNVSALAQRIIVLVIMAGFPVTLVLVWLFDFTSGGVVRTEGLTARSEAAHLRHERRVTDRTLNYILGALLLCAVAYFVLDHALLRRARAQGPAEVESVAVLPLVNTSGDPSNEYFSDGLSEELIAVLAKIPNLKVIGRSSSFLFKNKSEDSASIGEKLGVSHLIEGSVRKQGDRVRIVAELIKTSDGRELWSDTYDRELKDVFAVQSEIAQAVAAQMKVKLLGVKPRSDAAPSNQNLAAYNAVLQSDFYFRRQTAESLRQAISYAEEAIRLDPKYALAWAKLSNAWRQYGASFAGGDAEKSYAKAREAADKAISLAPDSVATILAAGWVYMTPDLNFQAAEREFRRTLELAPGDALAKTALGFSVMAQGRNDEAERIFREAAVADPLYFNVWYNLGRLSLGTGRWQEAEEYFRKALEIEPEAARFHTGLATLDILRANPTAALQQARLEPDGFWHFYAMALAAQAGNDRAAADAALGTFAAKYAASGAYQVATLYAFRHEPEQMFHWLHEAYVTHDSGLTQLSITPFILTYREDPRFVALCQKLKVHVPPSVQTKP